MPDSRKEVLLQGPHAGHAGPIATNRKCRDLVMLLVFVAAWGFNGYVGYNAIKTGDPERLVNGYDIRGRTCGVSQCYAHLEECNCSADAACDLTQRAAVFYPNPLELRYAVCLPACPTSIQYLDMNQLQNVTNQDSVPFIIPQGFSNLIPGAPSNQVATYPSTELPTLHRCVPLLGQITKSLPSLQLNVSIGDFVLVFESSALAWDQMIGDVHRHRWVLLSAIGISVGVGFVYLYLMRFLVGIVTWLTVILVNVCCLLITAVLLYKVGLIDPTKLPGDLGNGAKDIIDDVPFTDAATSSNRTALLYIAIGFGALSAFLLLSTCCMCSRIAFAVRVMKHASRVLGNMPQLIFAPLVPLAAAALVLSYFVVLSLFLASTGTWSDEKHKYKLDAVQRHLFLYHLFVCLWSWCAIHAAFEFVVAHCVVIWFFSRRKEAISSPLRTSLANLFRYHFGSIVFGALVVAMIKAFRLMFRWLAAKMQEARDNKTIQHCLACVDCALGCFERCVEFLNENAYIEIALKGKAFCPAAKDALLVLSSNALRVAAVQTIAKPVLLLGKVSITLATTVIAALLLMNFEPSSKIDPLSLLVCIGAAYAVASLFMALFDMAIDTVFVCMAEDTAMYTEAEQYTEEETHQIVKSHAELCK